MVLSHFLVGFRFGSYISDATQSKLCAKKVATVGIEDTSAKKKHEHGSFSFLGGIQKNVGFAADLSILHSVRLPSEISTLYGTSRLRTRHFSKSFSTGGHCPDYCLWCEGTVCCEKSDADKRSICFINKCIKLPYDTLRMAVNLFGQKKRYPCNHCSGPKYYVSPEALEEHYEDEHKELYAGGSKCECGAFFENRNAREDHKNRTDVLRCPHVPGENVNQRRARLHKEKNKAYEVDFQLKKWGF